MTSLSRPSHVMFAVGSYKPSKTAGGVVQVTMEDTFPDIARARLYCSDVSVQDLRERSGNPSDVGFLKPGETLSNVEPGFYLNWGEVREDAAQDLYMYRVVREDDGYFLSGTRYEILERVYFISPIISPIDEDGTVDDGDETYVPALEADTESDTSDSESSSSSSSSGSSSSSSSSSSYTSTSSYDTSSTEAETESDSDDSEIEVPSPLPRSASDGALHLRGESDDDMDVDSEVVGGDCTWHPDTTEDSEWRP